MGSNYISERAHIGKGVLFGINVAIYGDCLISEDCVIGDNVTIGFPNERDMKKKRDRGNDGSPKKTIDGMSTNPTYIGKNVQILSNSVVYSDVRIDDKTIVYEHSRIGPGTRIGSHCKLRYGTQIYTDVSIGNNCIISGFCCSRSSIGSDSTMLGNLVHKYHTGWIDNLKEPAPKIDEHVIVGYNALIIGDIKISKLVYIGAGAIVTKSVPSESIVVGNCEIYPAEKWKGKLNLKKLFASQLEDETVERP